MHMYVDVYKEILSALGCALGFTRFTFGFCLTVSCKDVTRCDANVRLMDTILNLFLGCLNFGTFVSI